MDLNPSDTVTGIYKLLTSEEEITGTGSRSRKWEFSFIFTCFQLEIASVNVELVQELISES